MPIRMSKRAEYGFTRDLRSRYRFLDKREAIHILNITRDMYDKVGQVTQPQLTRQAMQSVVAMVMEELREAGQEEAKEGSEEETED